MVGSYGKIGKRKTPSPSSSTAIKAAAALQPHADLIPPPAPETLETARRAAFYDEVRGHLEKGLIGHEILALYPQEKHWMHDKVIEWEVIYRREQIQFVENLGRPYFGTFFLLGTLGEIYVLFTWGFKRLTPEEEARIDASDPSKIRPFFWGRASK